MNKKGIKGFQKGHESYWKNKKLSIDHREKMRETAKEKYHQIT